MLLILLRLDHFWVEMLGFRGFNNVSSEMDKIWFGGAPCVIRTPNVRYSALFCVETCGDEIVCVGYLQELVYKLSKVGQAIDNNDLSAASSVLGGSTDADWVKKANKAFTKVT